MPHNSNYQLSILEKEFFWKKQTSAMPWYKMPLSILSKNEQGFYRWFEDGMINMSYCCLDWQIEQGRGAQTALLYDSPVTNTICRYTFIELKEKAAKFANGLKHLGIGFGDTVVIYMPMIPEAVIAMLACARIGAIHSVVFGGFAPHELAMRIDDAKPAAIISASYGIEVDRKILYKPMVDQAIEEATFKPAFKIFYQRVKDFDDLTQTGERSFESLYDFPEIEAVPVLSSHPLYILYTSGTTGKPKGIVRDHGGYATALKFSMENIYDVKAGDVYWAASDVGWVVGHSYIVYGPLLQGCTTLLYEGKPVRTPDAGAFWRVIAEHKVNLLFTAPTAIRAIRKEDNDGLLLNSYSLNSLKYLFLAGERCDAATYNWAKAMLHIPVIDHWWQTESGWPMLGVMMGIEQLAPKAGSAGLPICGYDIQVLSEEGEPLPQGTEGYITVKLPLPPGCLPTLWKNDERFKAGYLQHFPGYYQTGDGGFKDADGYFYITGRIDDVINVSGHRLSTGEMEELVAGHPAIAECAVVGIADDMRGQRPVALIVLKDGRTETEQLMEIALVQMIREKIGPVACFHNAAIVTRLPKTRSGKILRKTIRQIADGDEYLIPSTIEDPAVLTEITIRLQERRIGLRFQNKTGT